MDRKVKIGVLGAGLIGKRHIQHVLAERGLHFWPSLIQCCSGSRSRRNTVPNGFRALRQ